GRSSRYLPTTLHHRNARSYTTAGRRVKGEEACRPGRGTRASRGSDGTAREGARRARGTSSMIACVRLPVLQPGALRRVTRLTTLGGLVMGILACQPGVSGEAPATGSPEPARARSAAADPAEDGSAGQGAARPVSAVGEQDARPTGGDPTLARIDAFLRYQERRLTLEAALWTELEAAIPKPRRGGRARSVVQAPSRASLELLERRAEEDEAALAAVGLSRPELAELGALVREVLGPR